MDETVSQGLPDARLLTVREVAARLSVSTRMVQRLIRRGALQEVRLGRAVRVSTKCVRDFIANGGVK